MTDDLDIGADDELAGRLKSGFGALAAAAGDPPPLPDPSTTAARAPGTRSRRRLLVAAAIVAVVAIGAGIAITQIGGDAGQRVTSNGPGAPVPPPEGVLVSGGSIAVGGQDAEVAVGPDDELFRMTATYEDRQLTLDSRPGTLLGWEGMPIRCGEAAVDPSGRSLEERTGVASTSAHLVVLNDEGLAVSITAVDPPLAANNADAMPGLPAEELKGSVLVSQDMAQRLADQPADEPLTVQRWEHEFDAGVTVQAELRGTLSRELSYIFEFSGDGKPAGSSTNISGLPCNRQGVITNSTSEAMHVLVLLAGGTSLRVDGETVTDTQPDAAMQGSWAIATVTAKAETANVEVVDRQGTVIEQWTMTYDDGTD